MAVVRTLLAALLRLRNSPIETVVVVLRRKGLLLTSMTCSSCHGLMIQRKKKSQNRDGLVWQCNRRHCAKFKSTISIRTGSFFEKFKISLKNVWFVIAYWLEDFKCFEVVKALNLEKKMVLRIFKALRIIVSDHLITMPIRLGGPGIVCQIDETLVFHKAKYNRGRRARQQWVFGIVDTSFKPAKGVLFEVRDRSANTLLPIIERTCHPGTVIHSDEWAAYNSIRSRLGFEHGTVNHSVNFISPEDGVHTQHVEAYWSQFKRHLKYMNGLRAENLEGFMDEYMWKAFYGKRKFLVLLGLLVAHQ